MQAVQSVQAAQALHAAHKETDEHSCDEKLLSCAQINIHYLSQALQVTMTTINRVSAGCDFLHKTSPLCHRRHSRQE